MVDKPKGRVITHAYQTGRQPFSSLGSSSLAFQSYPLVLVMLHTELLVAQFLPSQ